MLGAKRSEAFGLFVGAVYLFWGAQLSLGQDSKIVHLGDINFTIPSDCRLEVATNNELTTWPIVADWDSAGRLLVVESGGVAKPIVEHNKKLLHRIVRLEDKDGDGVFDLRTVVAKDLPFTEGVLCIGDELLASAPPNIYRLSDRDSDGLYEQREVWFDGQTITGCANDLHGPYLGKDGWIYWCKGAFAEQRHELIGGKELKSKAAHIFRRRLTGGAIEPVMTGGMDNPVGMAITPEGDRFFTSTFLHHPGNGLRDGIAHAVYGGVYGKDHPQVLDDHWRTGPLMPVMVELGAAAPSGLMCMKSNRLSGALNGERTLVAALFNLQKVGAYQLKPKGASYTTINRDLVVGDRVDFHPTDVLEDSDGSLLIVDTGGWYDLCCPTSRVDQKTAAGGIYRLVKENGDAKVLPRNPLIAWDKVSPAELADLLVDARPWIARQALLQVMSSTDSKLIGELAARTTDAKQPLDARIAYLWSLIAIGDESSMSVVTSLLDDADASMVQVACEAVSLYRWAPARASIEKLLLSSPSLAVRRVAAEVLGRIGGEKVATKLLQSLADDTSDRHLLHSVTYALLELGAVEETAKFASKSNSPAQQLVAMQVLDQLGAAERLPVDFMLAAMTSDSDACRTACSQVLAKNSGWAERYRAPIEALCDSSDSSPAVETIVRGWRSTETIINLVRDRIAIAKSKSRAEQLRVARLLSNYAGSEVPASWVEPLTEWLAGADAEIQLTLAEKLAELKLNSASRLKDQLIKLAKQSGNSRDQLAFLAALPSDTSLGDEALESKLLSALVGEESEELAIVALQRIRLSRTGGTRLMETLREQPPRSLAVAVEAIQRIGHDALDQKMLTMLREIPVARTLSMDQLTNLYRQRSAELQKVCAETVSVLSKAPGDVEEKVDAMLAKLKPGDPVKGLQLFRSSKVACSACHRLGYVGGEIGPELSRIGASRTRRALLEAILFPSARLEQSYQSTKVLTRDGQVLNGLATKQSSASELVLQLSADKSTRIATSEIERQEVSSTSIMPAGLADILTVEELSDLLAILEAAK